MLNRALAFLLLPGICFLWFIGWSLIWISQHPKQTVLTVDQILQKLRLIDSA